MPRNQHIDIPTWVPEDSSELPAAVGHAFDEARPRIVTAMKSFLDDQPAGMAFMQLEEELRDLSSLVVANLLACVIALVHKDEDEVAECKVAAREQSPVAVKDHGRKKTRVQFSSGITLDLRTPYLAPDHSGRPGKRRGRGRRRKAGGGCYPVLVALGIRFLASPLLQSLTAASTVRSSSFAEATDDLASHGCNLDPKTVRRLALAVGRAAQDRRTDIATGAVDAQDAQRGGALKEFAGKRIAIGEDGARMLIRKDNGRKTKKGRHKTAPEWKEPKGFVIYVLDDKGKKVRTAGTVYDFTLGDADAVLALLIAELLTRGAADAKEISVVADGADWIWNRVDDIAHALGWAPEDITRVADFYHAVERLGDMMDLCPWMTEDENFELVCFRSVGAFMFDWLSNAAREGSLPEYL